MSQLDRVQSIVVTDSLAFGKETRGKALPPVQIYEPDRIAAFQDFLKTRQKRWKKVPGEPSNARFQCELISNHRPIATIWLEAGFVQMTTGDKRLQGMQLSQAETVELLATLGLPTNILT